MMNSCSSSYACNASFSFPTLVQMCGATKFLVFMSLLDEMIRSNPKISGNCEEVTPIEMLHENYDFVIIGGGGAGSAVAARLSENENWTVRVLEAGPTQPPGSQIPQYSLPLQHTLVDWNYTTTNESHICRSRNGSCPLSAGRMLGGSTSHNAMIYLRGSPESYDNWAAMGNDGWSWKDVKPFFLKSEDNGEIERVGRVHHATGGPVSVERFPHSPTLVYSALAASAEAGYGVSEDLNGDQNTGFSISQTTSKKGVRCSSSKAYLEPVRNRKNLHVTPNCHVTRILIKNQTAVGVEYYQNGELKKVFATREVVLSAGTINSPQVLILSGIGPKEHLKSIGVELVQELPGVGENFQEHPAYRVNFAVNEPDEYTNNWEIAAQYLVNQTGPLSTFGLVAATGMLCTKAATPGNPDVQLHLSGHLAVCAPGEVGALQSTGPRVVAMQVTNMVANSRGTIRLSSKDPFEKPIIWGNYLSHPSDIEVLIEGIEFSLAMANTTAFRAHNFTLHNPYIEACSDYTILSKEYWACAIRENGITENHPAGTCKMGPSSDPMAVVDPKLRVHGIERLRIADNSIMPRILPSNTAAPAMMIGERVADFIKIYWSQKSN